MKKIAWLLVVIAFWMPPVYATERPGQPGPTHLQKKRKHLKPRKHKHGHLKHRTLTPGNKKAKPAAKKNGEVVRLQVGTR